MKLNRAGKIKALHCAECGILIGYDNTITDSFCVTCGQKILAQEAK